MGKYETPFSEKQKTRRKIILIDDEKVISDDGLIAENMNTFFVNTVENLGIQGYDESHKKDELNDILDTFKEHPSILKINSNICINEKFAFLSMTNKQMKDEIQKLNNRKATAYEDIPAKILKDHNDTVTPHLKTIYENSKEFSVFPDGLKEADVTPVFKKDDNTNKENYRPVSILPTVSKIYERNMYDQIYAYIGKFLSPYLCGFRKGYSTQYSIAAMVENWNKCLDNYFKGCGTFNGSFKSF